MFRKFLSIFNLALALILTGIYTHKLITIGGKLYLWVFISWLFVIGVDIFNVYKNFKGEK